MSLWAKASLLAGPPTQMDDGVPLKIYFLSCSLHRLMAPWGMGSHTYPSLQCMSPGPSVRLVRVGLHGFLGPLNDLPVAILAHCRSRRDGAPLVQDIPECSPQLLVRVSWKTEIPTQGDFSGLIRICEGRKERELCKGGVGNFKKTRKVLAPRLAIGARDAGQPLSPLSSFWHWTLKS